MSETPTKLAEVLPALRGAPLSLLVSLASRCPIGYPCVICVSDVAKEIGYTRRMTHLAFLALRRMGIIDFVQDHRRQSPTVRIYPTLHAADPIPLGAALGAPIAWTSAPSAASPGPSPLPGPVSPAGNFAQEPPR